MNVVGKYLLSRALTPYVNNSGRRRRLRKNTLKRYYYRGDLTRLVRFTDARPAISSFR